MEQIWTVRIINTYVYGLATLSLFMRCVFTVSMLCVQYLYSKEMLKTASEDVSECFMVGLVMSCHNQSELCE